MFEASREAPSFFDVRGCDGTRRQCPASAQQFFEPQFNERRST